MKKLKVLLVFMVLLTMGLFQAATGESIQASQAIEVWVDGQELQTGEGLAFIKEGRIMVPLKVICDRLGAKVTWDGKTQAVGISKGRVNLIMTIGSPVLIRNGVEANMDVSPLIRSGSTMVPLRFVAQYLGAQIQWEPDRQKATITSGVYDYEAIDLLHPFTATNINGGRTGIFQRKQLDFRGFDGIEADVVLPQVNIADSGDCPYMYFGLDFPNDQGNIETGFEYVETSQYPDYVHKWTVILHQDTNWYWGKHIILEQGSTHHLKFYCQEVDGGQTDMVVELDGVEIIRKPSLVTDFSQAAAKSVIAMAMVPAFDGTNCNSTSLHGKIWNIQVSRVGDSAYVPFEDYPLYSQWKPQAGSQGMWFGSADCVPAYLHFEEDGYVSIYK